MRISKLNWWNWIAVVGLCIAYITLRGGTGPVLVSETPAPLCTPLVESFIQDPAAAVNSPSSGHSSGPLMKYGASPRPDAEAEFLAFSMRDQLLATDEDYDRISRDLANIRQLFPAMQEIRYFGDYADGELMIMLIAPINPLISTQQYDETNRFMGLCIEDRFASFAGYDVATLRFPGRMNMEVLANRYHPSLMPNLHSMSSPVGRIGIDDYIHVTSASEKREVITANTVLIYEFVDGWLDCFDGCECKDIHTLQTDASGDVVFIGREFQFLPGWEQICLDSWEGAA